MQGSRRNRQIDENRRKYDEMASKLTLKSIYADQPKNPNAKKAFKKASDVIIPKKEKQLRFRL